MNAGKANVDPLDVVVSVCLGEAGLVTVATRLGCHDQMSIINSASTTAIYQDGVHAAVTPWSLKYWMRYGSKQTQIATPHCANARTL